MPRRRKRRARDDLSHQQTAIGIGNALRAVLPYWQNATSERVTGLGCKLVAEATLVEQCRYRRWRWLDSHSIQTFGEITVNLGK